MNELAIRQLTVDSPPQRSPTTRRANGSSVKSSGSSRTPTVGQALREVRPDPGALQAAEEAAVVVDAHAEVEEVDVLEHDGVALHAEHLAHVA